MRGTRRLDRRLLKHTLVAHADKHTHAHKTHVKTRMYKQTDTLRQTHTCRHTHNTYRHTHTHVQTRTHTHTHVQAQTERQTDRRRMVWQGDGWEGGKANDFDRTAQTHTVPQRPPCCFARSEATSTHGHRLLRHYCCESLGIYGAGRGCDHLRRAAVGCDGFLWLSDDSQ